MGIREIRREKNITQKQLAEKVGVDLSVISKYESGKITPPVDKLQKVAAALGVSIDALLGDSSLIQHSTTAQHYQSGVYDDMLVLFSSDAARQVLKNANGICELCGQPAPFKNPDGTPHLEPHYIQWLMDGGKPELKNTVALCPNCHQKIHVLNSEQDIEHLRKIAENH